jgi:hypothetical protein
LPEPNWTLEWLKIAQGLLGTLVGGGLVLLGGWLADRRKNSTEELLRERREKALLTGMFAVRNFVMERLNEWEESGLLSRLEPLRTAQAYVHRLIDKAPGESESLMITVIEMGLKLDALIATIDRRFDDPGLKDPIALASMITRQVEEVAASIEQFDIFTSAELTMMTDEDLADFPGFKQAQERPAEVDKPL